MKKPLISVVLAIATALSLAACGSDEKDASKDVAESSAQVSSGTSSAASDDENSDSESSEIKDNSSVDNSSDDSSVDLPSSAELEITCKDALEDTDMFFSVENNGSNADSYWYVTYGPNEVKAKVYVNDSCLVKGGESGDGVLIYLGEVGRSYNYVDGKIVKVFAGIDGQCTAKVYENGDFSKEVTVSASVEGWEYAADKQKGYVMSINIPYEVVGFDSESAYEALGIAPAISNNNGTEATVGYATDFSCKPGCMNGLVKLVDGNRYEANEYSGVVNLGPLDVDVPASGNWDTTYDYAEGDENYADRKVTLDSNATNTIYFTGVDGPVLYAEGTFKISAIKNNDPWPKFGFLFNDGFDNGLFCFIDAGTGDETKTELTDIFTDCAGYVHVTANEYRWTDTEKIDWPTGWTYDQEVKLAVFRNGDTVKFYVNDIETHVINGVDCITDTSKVSVGLSVFNLDIEVTDYRCTDDVNDAKIQELLK